MENILEYLNEIVLIFSSKTYKQPYPVLNIKFSSVSFIVKQIIFYKIFRVHSKYFYKVLRQYFIVITFLKPITNC